MAEITSALVAPPPKHSLSVSISVSAGKAQSQRSLGMYTGYYPSVISTTELYLDLQPGISWEGSVTGALFINSDQPLELVAVKDDGVQMTVNMNRMLFLDEPLKSWTLVNNTNNDATVFISASVPAQTAGSLQPGAVRSVNGQTPDANGNIQVDTGVMTIDHVQPDAAGNINTDEQNY